MLTPAPFFAPDFFATDDITLPRLQKFVVDVITRLTADNPGGVFTALIADLQAAHDDLFGAVARADQGTSHRRTAAQAMWGAIHAAQHQLEANEDLLNYKAKKKPAIRQDFFPNGRQEYGHTTLLTAEKLLNRLATAAATHAQVLGEEFDANLYAGYLQAFLDGRDATGQGDEQTAKARAATQGHRTALTRRLTDAVKLVAAHFLRDGARATAYFRTGLLQP